MRDSVYTVRLLLKEYDSQGVETEVEDIKQLYGHTVEKELPALAGNSSLQDSGIGTCPRTQGEAGLDPHPNGVSLRQLLNRGKDSAEVHCVDTPPATFNQAKPDSGHTYYKGKRGPLSAYPDGRWVMKLLGQVNKSTLLDESGQLCFVEYQWVVREGIAPERMQKDMPNFASGPG